VDEDIARSYTEDILGCIPGNSHSVVCGDFNARIGELSPTINDIAIPRCSVDKYTNARAKWLISICEQDNWHILNGI
jgi:hypothetical protein